MAALSARLARLQQFLSPLRLDPADCPAPTTCLLTTGQQPPPDSQRCRLCGSVHPVVVVETVISKGNLGKA